MIKTLSLFQNKQPPFLNEKLDLIKANISSFNFLKAKELILEIIFYMPFEKDLWNKLSICLTNLKEYKKAISVYNTLIFLEPNNANIYIDAAKCFLSLNEYKKALISLNKAEKITKDKKILDLIFILKKQNNLINYE
ncbi:MAG: hypothetical protein K1060chlam5_01368 [Candidatus Anoxychlamydiales bacterium]|nr:hypothetical protein [Candidatus Anoxychlamydiales bacterium]